MATSSASDRRARRTTMVQLVLAFAVLVAATLGVPAVQGYSSANRAHHRPRLERAGDMSPRAFDHDTGCVDPPRRAFLRRIAAELAAAAFVSASGMAIAGAPSEALASPYCTQGVGSGCEDLSEGNDFVRALQEKSAANREQHTKEAREAFYMKNYPDWFGSIGKTLVKKPDGTFLVVDDTELEGLRRDNRLAREMPKTLGGKFADLTQKPVLVLRE